MSDRKPAVRVTARRWSPAVVLGVAALFIVAAVAIVLLLSNRTEPSASATPTPTAGGASLTASQSVTASPSATPETTATPEAGWTLARVAERAAEPAEGAVFFGVHWHEGPGWIAYGVQANTEDADAGVWTSADGTSWTLAELPSGLEGRVMDLTHAEVDGATRFVALVAVTGGSQVLISDDGTSWEAAATPAEPAMLYAVAHGPAGFVATGAAGGSSGTVTPGRMWTSPDGAEWAESAPAAFEDARALGIEALDDTYVAVGFPNFGGPPTNAWTSTDAVEWTVHELAPPSDGGCICLATDALDGRMIVLGRQSEAFAALTEDGASWSLEVLGEGMLPNLTGAELVDDGTIIAGGRLNVADGPRDALIWVRDPGQEEWREVDWRSELAEPPDEDEIGLGGSVYVATSPDRTLFLIDDGTVLLTSGRIP